MDLNLTLAVWILIVFSVGAANLPFMTDRTLGVFPRLRSYPRKPAWLVVIELVVFYLIAGALGLAFERTLANPFAMTWEFYAITLCIFLVLGFPGFVYRYLLK